MNHIELDNCYKSICSQIGALRDFRKGFAQAAGELRSSTRNDSFLIFDIQVDVCRSADTIKISPALRGRQNTVSVQISGSSGRKSHELEKECHAPDSCSLMGQQNIGDAL